MTPARLAAAGLALAAAPAIAEDAPVRVAIGDFTSQQSCTLYAVTSGSEALVYDRRGAVAADAYGYAAASRATLAWARQWRTELVRDCVSHFPALRNSIVAALAASGRVTVVPPGTRGALVLNGRVSDVGVTSNSVSAASFDRAADTATLTVEFSLAGRGGTSFGGSAIKNVTFGERLDAGGVSYRQGQSDGATYARLQRELSLAVSRAIAFHFSPLRVVANAGQRLRVNYGAPLLPLGAAVTVDAGPAMGMIRTNVVAAGAGFADVESEGGIDLSAVPPGSLATFAEPEDPAANARRLPRTELPF
ncbi:MAG TPA: hypothetical protein VGW40_06410 [Allosphingosinicella sp.]|nr:hypothetical protein [Allosphingosinicella sp.]